MAEIRKVLKLDARDNVLVALTPLAAQETVTFGGKLYAPASAVPAKFKFVESDMAAGSEVVMYGVVVGRVREAIPAGTVLTTRNLQHDSSSYTVRSFDYQWTPPEISRWRHRTFAGYHRKDGQVGTRNYWLVLPLVFCENRNIELLRDAFEEELGYGKPNDYRQHVRDLLIHRKLSSAQLDVTKIAAESSRQSSVSQRRRHQISCSPGWLRRHTSGCTCAVWPAGRLHPQSQRCRRYRVESRLSAC